MEIAFDSGSTMGAAAASTLTVSHTCSGANRILFAGVNNANNTYTMSATYNGVAMTELTSLNGAHGEGKCWLFFLVAPDTGTHDLVFTSNSVTALRGAGISYTGASQTDIPDAYLAENNASFTTSQTISVTTIADNCWVTGFFHDNYNGQNVTAGAGTTSRSGTGQAMCCDNNAAKTPAGSVSLVGATAANTWMDGIIASFKPSVASGPATLKTWNGATTATIKTLGATAIASVKTWNGVA